MSEEMRNDESIYLMGEEVAEYNGAYKASKGMLAEFGEKRVDNSNCRAWIYWNCRVQR
jgi:pyruvate dehydrogenase E1 component beta subunit